MASVDIGKVDKFFGSTQVLYEVEIEIGDGEFVVLVGPSGCGKSTLLRMIAGLEEISRGEIAIGGRVVNNVPPKDRDIAMVFQNYALYPHMTVYNNMAFSLKLAKAPKDEIQRRVQQAAQILGLQEYLERFPRQLSGGQRQRVAMGRAIVREPAAYLMDEPLSNLDAKLRVQMRTEVARIQQRMGTTTVYVTHDQTEAMTLGDRVAVMRAGEIQQVDTPMELYNKPKNLFVAGFIGSPAMNFMPATVEGGKMKLPMAEVDLPEGVEASGEMIAGIRPEHFEDVAQVDESSRSRGATFKAKIDVLESMGSELYAHFDIAAETGIESKELEELAQDAGAADLPSGEAGQVTARLSAESEVKEGQEVELWVDVPHIQLFDQNDGRCLTAR
jgi:multiple sugar transport system ATP-binding protein